MTIKPVSPILIPPSPPSNGAGASSVELAAVSALLATSQDMLREASENLNESIALGQGVKKHRSAHAAAVGRAAPAASAKTDPAQTQTQLTAEAYSLICQIHTLYQGVSTTGTQWADFYAKLGNFGGDGLYTRLQALLAQITDPTVKGQVSSVINELVQGQPDPTCFNPPFPKDWNAWFKASKLETVIGQWLGNKDQNNSMDSELTTRDDQMNLLQIMITLGQDTSITIEGKTVDELFWGNNKGIFETVIAYFMANDGVWGGGKNALIYFLKFLPQANSSKTPNYNLFVQGIKNLVQQDIWPYGLSAEDLLSDGFAFNSAWSQFRTGSQMINPNYVKYGS